MYKTDQRKKPVPLNKLAKQAFKKFHAE